jgi:hypothetical protein
MSLPVRTNEEWTVHSMNIHGTFFERACRRVVTNTQGWQVISTNYPVEFPPPNGPWRGTESKLDIRAEYTNQEHKLTLLIECKKHNPELTDWIFFPTSETDVRSTVSTINIIYNDPLPEPSTTWNVQSLIGTFSGSYVLADDARETRGSYIEYAKQNGLENMKRTITKTSSDAIETAAYHIALATRAIVHEEQEYSTALRDHAQSQRVLQVLPYRRQVLLPVIVTTAKLFVCVFDLAQIDIASGELPLDKARIVEYPSLLYRYALPRSLQYHPGNMAGVLPNGDRETFRRMDILIVTSTALSTALSQLMPLAK